MVRSHPAIPYRCYRATNATSACIGYVPTVPTPRYPFVGQFANTATVYVHAGRASYSSDLTLPGRLIGGTPSSDSRMIGSTSQGLCYESSMAEDPSSCIYSSPKVYQVDTQLRVAEFKKHGTSTSMYWTIVLTLDYTFLFCFSCHR
jgi:hypothetical protein